jgi:hypothetical protein
VLRESLQADGALSQLGRGGTLFFRLRTGHMRPTSSVVCHRTAAGARSRGEGREGSGKRLEAGVGWW